MGRGIPNTSAEQPALVKDSSSKGRSVPTKTAEAYEKGIDKRKVEMVQSGDMYISTGSTLLDLALTGTRVKGGGMPGGIIAEIFGESGLGKTALVSEMCASSQLNKGVVRFNDPEARLDQDYAQIYGMSLEGDNYQRLHLVNECFDDIRKWEPENENTINVYACDSLAALTTEMEMGDSGDKMGMRRAKEFSAGLRKLAVIIGKPHKLLLLTNQVRQGEFGSITPGGKGIPFYCSIRMEVKSFAKVKGKSPYITKKVTMGKKRKEVLKTIGINVVVKMVKNTKNDPFREAPVCIVFGYGIDDIRANLQWTKDITGETSYDCIDKTVGEMEKAIDYIEENKLISKLKEQTTKLWYELESKLKVTRRGKIRE